MLEFGKYAGAIFGAWGVALGLLVVLIVLTWVQSRNARRKHDEIEARRQSKEKAQ